MIHNVLRKQFLEPKNCVNFLVQSHLYYTLAHTHNALANPLTQIIRFLFVQYIKQFLQLIQSTVVGIVKVCSCYLSAQKYPCERQTPSNLRLLSSQQRLLQKHPFTTETLFTYILRLSCSGQTRCCLQFNRSTILQNIWCTFFSLDALLLGSYLQLLPTKIFIIVNFVLFQNRFSYVVNSNLFIMVHQTIKKKQITDTNLNKIFILVQNHFSFIKPITCWIKSNQ